MRPQGYSEGCGTKGEAFVEDLEVETRLGNSCAKDTCEAWPTTGKVAITSGMKKKPLWKVMESTITSTCSVSGYLISPSYGAQEEQFSDAELADDIGLAVQRGQ